MLVALESIAFPPPKIVPRVEEPLTVSAPVPSAEVLLTRRVPAERVVPPEKEFRPEIDSVLAPVFKMPPVPLTTPPRLIFPVFALKVCAAVMLNGALIVSSAVLLLVTLPVRTKAFPVLTVAGVEPPMT